MTLTKKSPRKRKKTSRCDRVGVGMGFIQKTINPGHRLGVDLIELREKAGLSQAQASHITKIPEYLIRALEEERWEEIQDPVYFEHLYRTYLSLLGANHHYYIQKYRECLKQSYQKRRKEELLPRPSRVRMTELVDGSRWIAIAGVSIFVLLVGGYLFTRVRAITAPPILVLESPEDGKLLEEPRLEVRGKTSSEASVTVNGKSAVVKEDGSFESTLDVPRGTTVLTVEARKRHGRTARETRHILFNRPLPSFSGIISTTSTNL